MSTGKSSMTILPYPQGEFIPRSAQGALPLVAERDCEGAGMTQQPEGFRREFGSFFRERWRDMKVMHAAFQQAESGAGARSRDRSAERLREKLAWSRMDDE